MLKRIFPVFVVAVILVSLLCVPASAIGVGSTDDSLRYAALNFDTIDFDSVDFQQYFSLPFPFNSASSGVGKFSYGDDGTVASGSQTIIDTGSSNFPTLVGSLTLPSLSYSQGKTASFSLIGGQQIVDHNRLSTYAISANTDNIHVTSAKLYIAYYTIDRSEIPKRYVSSLQQKYITVPIVNGEIMLGGALVDNLDLGTDYRYTFFQTIKLDISFYRKSLDTTVFSFTIPSDGSNYPNSHIYLDNWLAERGVKYDITVVDPEYFDVTEWLETSIGSFLKLELFPGFSIDHILYLILVLILLIAFIKLLS